MIQFTENGMLPDAFNGYRMQGRKRPWEALKAGIDPSHAKQEEKRKLRNNAETTFEAVAREWHEHMKAGWSQGYPFPHTVDYQSRILST